jgi:hypothetical protein
MAMVAVLARFDFLPGYEQEIHRFFAEGRTIVEDQPVTTGWYAARLGPTTYAAFAVFASEADRDKLLAAGGPALSKTYGHLFAAQPTFEKAEIIECRPPVPTE